MENRAAYRWQTPAAFFIIGLSVVICYFPTFTGEFLLDDHVLIRNNPFIAERQSFQQYLSQEDGILDPNEWEEEFHTGYYRPLINLTYFIDYTIWGMNPVGFRISNLVFHLLACCVLYAILMQFCRNYQAALMLSLLFALHPVQTEAVSWVASRNNILATLFGLAAFACYTASAAGIRYALLRTLAVLCFLISMFCKEFGVMLLPILFLYNRIQNTQKTTATCEFVGYLPFVAALIAYLLIRTHVTGSLVSPEAGHSLWWRIGFAPYLVSYNLSLLLFPVGLHNFLVVYPSAFWSVESVAGILIGILLSLLMWVFRKDTLVVFGLLSFLVGLFPVLNIIPTASATLIAMRWLYFPFAFLCVALGSLSTRTWGRKAAIVGVGILCILGWQTYQLNRDHWHDEPSFFKNEVERHQNLFYAGALAELHAQQGDFRRAEEYFKKGIDASPRMIETQINYSAMLIETGRFTEALNVIDAVLPLTMSKKNRGGLYSNQGLALARTGRLQEAISALEAALEYSPKGIDIIGNLGTVYGLTGAYEKAVAILKKGIAMDPDAMGLKQNLAATYLRTGAYGLAIDTLESLPADYRQRDPAIAALLETARTKARLGASAPDTGSIP